MKKSRWSCGLRVAFFSALFTLVHGTHMAQAASPIASGYGSDGPYVGAITTYTVNNPTNIGIALDPVRVYVATTAPAGKRPVLFISHGFRGDPVSPLPNHLPVGYPDLVRFAVGKGWTVVFVPYPDTFEVTNQARYDVLWGGFQTAVADAVAGARIDTTRIGIIGHSFGGGTVPWLAWKATREGWGASGAFAMLCAPWFEWRMDPTRTAQLPATMDVLMQVYDQDDKNDHEIAIQIYESLPQPPERRDFVRVSGGGGPMIADHATPASGGPNAVLDALDWYAVYRLLDAMADHAWNGVDAGRETALGHGSAAQMAMPATTSLISLWDAPVASQPSNLAFPWSSRDFYQPAPSLTLSLPTSDQVAGTQVTLSATAAGGTPGTMVEHVTFTAAGTVVGVDTTAPYQVQWTASGSGPVTIQAEAMDDNGRTTVATGTVQVIAASTPPVLQSVISRLTHGPAGALDVTLALTGEASIETRRLSTGNFSIVFTFDQPVTSAIATLIGVGAIQGTPIASGNTITVNLSGMANAQTLQIQLGNIVPQSGGIIGSTSVTFKLLQADFNLSTVVNSTDVSVSKSKLGETVNAATAPFDTNASGQINSTDVAITKSLLGTAAP